MKMINFKLVMFCGVCTVWFGGFIYPTNAQITARNTIPETISNCYRNTTAYNRHTRQPAHINNLISIIRKIERKEPQLDMRRLARTLVNRYMFDGLKFDPSARPDFQFNPKPEESIKTQLIKNFISIQADEIIPQGVLDNDEWCALHWMLSHSMNATVRDEELGYPFYGSNNPGSGYNSNPLGGSGGSGYNPNNGYNNVNNYNGNGNSGYSDTLRRGRRDVETNEDGIEEDYGSNSQEQEKEQDHVSSSEQKPNLSLEKDQSIEDKTVDGANEETPDKSPVQGKSALALPSDGDDDSKFARQVSQHDPKKTRRPIETGVVYTPWGSISAGRLLAGIAAGLQPMTIPVGSGSPYPNPGFGNGQSNNPYGGTGGNNPYGTGNNPFNSGSNPNPNYPANNQYGRRKRRQVSSITFQPLKNIHAATLAGDVGQAGIQNGRYPLTNVAAPRGIWNDTICPREYILEPYPYSDKEIYDDDATITYLTEAEARGGMDGLILGNNIQRWDNARMKLSELLDMYYSESGISGEPQFRACNRGALFSSSVDIQEILEQSRSFAYLYNNYTSVIPLSTISDTPSAFLQPIDDVYRKMSGIVSTIGSSDPPCKRRQSTGSTVVETDDNLKYTEVKSRIYAVLDHTATFDEILAQKRFIAQLAHEINVSPRGSRLGVVDGSSGQILISPNHTDSNAILACNVLSLPTQIKTQDILRVITSLKSEMERMRQEEERLNYESDLGVVVLFLIQGRKLDEGQKSEIKRLLNEFSTQFGDVKTLFASSKYQQGDFEGFLPNPTTDFIKIQATQNISDYADEFTKDMTNKAQGRLSYAKCNAKKYNQDEEHKDAYTLFVTPDTILYYKISPDYYYSSKNLRLRFTSDNGKVRICQSRSETMPNLRNQGTNGVSCKETTGSFVTPGTNQIDVEFQYSKPCGKNGNRNGCHPIYLSFTPTANPSFGQTGLDCTIEGCSSPNQVKVVFSHWDMRCNSGSIGFTSYTLVLATLIISLFMSQSST